MRECLKVCKRVLYREMGVNGCAADGLGIVDIWLPCSGI